MSTAVTPAKLSSLNALLTRGRDQIAAALPRHLTAERMIRLALTAFTRTPELHDCDLESIVGAVVQASQLGLELDGVLGHAYLVPFNNRRSGRKECQLIVGYKGLLALAKRNGDVSLFYAHVIHEADTFRYSYGGDNSLTHQPPPVGQPRGKPVGVFALVKYARTRDIDFEVMAWEDVLACQAAYARKGKDGKPYGPWVDDLSEMARKTVIRRLAKRCSLSPEFRAGVAYDEATDAEPGVARPLTPARMLEARNGACDEEPASEEQRLLLADYATNLSKSTEEMAWELRQVGCDVPGRLTAAQADRVLSKFAEEAGGEVPQSQS